MNNNYIDLQKFNLETIYPSFTIVIVGLHNTGKTTLINKILHTLNNNTNAKCPLKNTYVIDTIKNNKWTNNIPKTNISTDEPGASIKQFMDLSHNDVYTRTSFNTLVMKNLEYTTTLSSILKMRVMRMLFMNGKNAKTNMIMSMTYPISMNIVLISNIDYMFIFKSGVESNKRILYDKYCCDYFKSYEEFCYYLDTYTEPKYNCLVIDVCGSYKNKLSDCVFWYNCDYIPENSNNYEENINNGGEPDNKKIKY